MRNIADTLLSLLVVSLFMVGCASGVKQGEKAAETRTASIATSIEEIVPEEVVAIGKELPPTMEAEDGVISGLAKVYKDAAASKGKGLAYLMRPGDGVTFEQLPAGKYLTVRYAVQVDGQLSLYVNGEFVKKMPFKATGDWVGRYECSTTVLNLPADATLEIRFAEKTDKVANLDYVVIH